MATWSTISCAAIVLGSALFVSRRNASRRQPYSLHHGRLNLHLPPQSMWMNMGFWGRTEGRKPASDLPEACRALLYRVFAAAGLMKPTKATDSMTPTTVNLLDVGFGCGDQIIEILTGDDFSHVHVKNYVGITSSKQQFAFADARLRGLGLQGDCNLQHGPGKVRVFGEDAAVPGQWSSELQENVDALPPNAVWLLGLDSLYHLSPSRSPLFNYAFANLRASIMAFELLLGQKYESLPLRTRLLLRFVCMMTGVPHRNLMTEEEYRKMLIGTGYQAENLDLADISESVFGPLADFLDRQECQLKAIGMSLGALRPAKTVFRWWANSGIVRGYLVIAKHRGHDGKPLHAVDTHTSSANSPRGPV